MIRWQSEFGLGSGFGGWLRCQRMARRVVFFPLLLILLTAAIFEPLSHDSNQENRLCWVTFEHCQVKVVLQVLQKNRGDPEFVVPQ